MRSKVRYIALPIKPTSIIKYAVIATLIVGVVILIFSQRGTINDYKKEVSRLKQDKTSLQAQVDTQNKIIDGLLPEKEKAQQEQTDLIAKVGRHTTLPEGETPTIATVSDVNKLSGQAFFEKALNGDKVLIYTQAKTAVLYRPSTDSIIN